MSKSAYLPLFWLILSPASSLLPQFNLLAGFDFGLYLWQKPQYRLAHLSNVLPSAKKAGCPQS
ncbi:MAG: hypothetical protein V7K77_27480 [Nostoc sp.]|uniref:hypothetical protein n=1 Tax=Nostoc sp. TaxID=1180 RepID=UPI002FF90492